MTKLHRVTSKLSNSGRSATGGCATTYTYDVLTGLYGVSQGSASTLSGGSCSMVSPLSRAFAHDGLGRLTSATNPETGSSATTYQYDNNSNLTLRTDVTGRQTRYCYDSINRLTGISYSNNCSSADVVYAWDGQISNGNGRLYSVQNANATQTVTGYDEVGHVLGSSQTMTGGQSYSFGYTWNLAGALVSTVYPSGRIVCNTYDGANRLGGVASNSSAACNGSVISNYLSGMSYAASGAPTAHVYGNSVTRIYNYNNRQQPYEITDSHSGSALLDLKYYYGNSTTLNGSSALNNGNPTQITEVAQSLTFAQTYGYDGVNRLSSIAEGNPAGSWSPSFSYDLSGNLAAPTATASPSAASPPATAIPAALSV